MLELIRKWILGLAGAAVFCAVAVELTPKGPVKGLVRSLCGVVMAAALLSPLLDFDFPAYSFQTARYRAAAEAVTADGEKIAGELNRRVIEDQLAAYILDKAVALDAPVTGAHVTLQWSSEGFWYPVAAELEGPYHADLSRCLEGELGIPAEAQRWRDYNEST